MIYSRRDMLKFGVGAVAICAAGTTASNLRAGAPAKKVPVGLQLYSVRAACAKDLPGTLAAIAEMGYQGVEFAGYHGWKAEDIRKMLDRNGLKSCGMHTKLDTVTGDALKGTVEISQTLGNKFLIVPILPEANLASLATLIDTAKLFTDLAEKLKDSGMRIGQHCETPDFKPVAGQIPWEVVFSHAGPDVVMQLDTGNCLDGGGDPVALLKKFPHRTATIHLKEHGGPKGAVIGEGKDVPWKQLFELCETIGDTEWYIVEQEEYRTTPLESVKLCLQNLRKMGK